MIRLIMADDHAILRKGLKQFFNREDDITVAAEASNGDEVIRKLGEQEFDLLLLDITMDGVSGAELIKLIKRIKPTLPILILSMHNTLQVALLALKAGADGYITKDSAPENLLEAIRKVSGGGKYIAPALAEKIAYRNSFPDQALPHVRLTSREYEVFRLLVAGYNINETSKQLFLSSKTVSTYKARIMEKMNIRNMVDLVRYAVLHGIAE